MGWRGAVRVLTGLGIVIAVSGSALAQGTDTDRILRAIQNSERNLKERIDGLERRVQQLERGGGGGSAATTPAPAAAATRRVPGWSVEFSDATRDEAAVVARTTMATSSFDLSVQVPHQAALLPRQRGRGIFTVRTPGMHTIRIGITMNGMGLFPVCEGEVEIAGERRPIAGFNNPLSLAVELEAGEHPITYVFACRGPFVGMNRTKDVGFDLRYLGPTDREPKPFTREVIHHTAPAPGSAAAR